jgi:Flp pilus assembly protein TadB
VSADALLLGALTGAAVAGGLLQPVPGRVAGAGPVPSRGAGGWPRSAEVVGRLGVPAPALAGLLALALAAGLVLPPLGLAVLATPFTVRWRRARRARAARSRALAVALPEAVDLLLLASGAGLSLPLALPLVAERAPEPVGGALRAVESACAAGSGRADALLGHVGALGDPAAALAHVLVDHLRYGVPLVPGLERAALELRLARRRRAEEEARKLPVRLLAPLLTCVLPAFVLLSVVPLLVAALRSLPR